MAQSHRTVPDVVRTKALAAGAAAWLDGLPALVDELEREWRITVGRTLGGGSEAFVAEATLDDGARAVLKLGIPRDDGEVASEITALRLADGRGCARLLRGDASRSALLLERLGRPLSDLGLPLDARHEILCATAARVWRPAPGCGLRSGADKGRWLVDYVAATWDALDRPCSERAVDHAIACAERRIAAHDDARAVLVHGDVHEWNALEADGGFRLVDPDGLLAEPEYDLGVVMREDPLERGDARTLAAKLARLTGLDADAIFEWGAVERVSTGLLCTSVAELRVEGRRMLAVADRVGA